MYINQKQHDHKEAAKELTELITELQKTDKCKQMISDATLSQGVVTLNTHNQTGQLSGTAVLKIRRYDGQLIEEEVVCCTEHTTFSHNTPNYRENHFAHLPSTKESSRVISKDDYETAVRAHNVNPDFVKRIKNYLLGSSS
jgi:hypothetical protein